MDVSLFDYDLPAERIAQQPRPRGGSRLLVLDRESGRIEVDRFERFPLRVERGDLLILNDTRVIPARLFGRRLSDGRPFELLLARRTGGERGEELWFSLLRPGRKAKIGDRLVFGEGLEAILLGREAGLATFRFEGAPVLETLDRIGVVPLPPYIERGAGPSSAADREAYQTVYARNPGAVAAPTAGLHFTPEILAEIEARGARIARVTLEVGLGTFKPVKCLDTREHVMDSERFEIPAETAELYARTRAEGGRICAVGTTSVRTLEAAVSEDGRTLRPGSGETALFVTPGYRFRAIDALLTNFHLPKSTLLMLVSAFAGRERVLAAYEKAKEAGLFFYSFGDAMWIDGETNPNVPSRST
jgi:S-adenosylmethionine:tRNA ribosyltransferase-isomerase